jgi:3alpha(or 20beta)-hydroxysteroid dehydrogenase
MFENKIAIVTGGTGGLGRVVTEIFAENGMKVYLPVRSIEQFRELFDNSKSEKETKFKLRKIYALQCDAEIEAEGISFISDVLKQENRVDYLINTVGGYHKKENVVDMDS